MYEEKIAESQSIVDTLDVEITKLESRISENREKLMQPETRDFTIVIADIENFKSKATADPAVVKQKFEQDFEYFYSINQLRQH